MPNIRWLLTMPLIGALGVGTSSFADEPGKVTSRGSYLTLSNRTSGFCGMCALEIDGRPAAAFGLYQAPGAAPQYTYLIFFKPDPKAAGGSGSGGEGKSEIDSEGNVNCDLKMNVMPPGREINVRLQLTRDAKTVTSDIFTIGDTEYGKDGPRVFLVDLAAEKPTPIPIKQMPAAVPSFADEDAWGQQILAARREMIEKSEAAKKFFGRN